MSRSKMSLMQFTFQTALNMLGSGIIMLPAKLASVGMISLISWVVTIVGVIALAYSFAKCGMYSRKHGGLGGIAEYTFGKSGSFLVNFIYTISLVIANVAIMATALSYLLATVHVTLSPMTNLALMVVLLWLATAANFRGAQFTGWITALSFWGIALALIVFTLAGPFWFDFSLLQANWNPHGYSVFEAMGHTVSMQLWAFLGLESACANSDSVENPETNVPRAVLIAAGFVAFLYVITTTLVGGVVPNAELVNSDAPFAIVFSELFGPSVSMVFAVLMSLTCYGSLVSWQFTVSRVCKTSADLGYFPRVFAKVSETDSPILGLLLIGVVQTILIGISFTPSLYKQFALLVDISVITNVIPYMFCVASLFSLVRLVGDKEKNPWVVFVMATIALLYTFYVFTSYESFLVRFATIVTFAGWVFYGMFIPIDKDVQH